MEAYRMAREILSIFSTEDAIYYCEGIIALSGVDSIMVAVKAAIIDLVNTQCVGWAQVTSSQLMELGPVGGVIAMNPARDLSRVVFVYSDATRN